MTNTMARSVSLVLLLFSVFISIVKGQPAAQGAADLSQLLQQAGGGKSENDLLEQNIKDIFGGGDVTPAPSNGGSATPTPTITGNSGGIPGTGTCTCVPYYLCNNGTINTNGEGIIDIRKNDGPCSTYIQVCCNKKDLQEQPIKPTPSPVKTSGCGNRHARGVGGIRITGDQDGEAQFGEFPWMVAVLREESVDENPKKLSLYQCGGALIHPQMVVTAAHCVSGNFKVFKIRAGEWDTQHTDEIFPYQDRVVETITVHLQYDAGTLSNDIAVLYLKSPVDIADNVNTVCLPPQDTVINAATCYATGWGKDVFGQKGKYQVILKKIDLPLVPNNKCQDQLRTTRLGKMFDLHRSFVCAGGVKGKDTCRGDGGSPLVCPIPGQNGRYYQVGIVAWGIGCGDDNIPGVYVNLPLFRDWIDNQMKSFGLDVKSYQY